MDISADPATGLYVAGLFNGNPARLGGATPDLVTHGGIDLFVAKYSTGGVPLAARSFGSTLPDYIHGITAAGGRILVVGQFGPTLEGLAATPIAGLGAGDGFVASFVAADLAAAPKVYTFGGNGSDTALAVARSSTGMNPAIAVGGSIQGMVDFGACMTCRPVPGGMRDGFVVKFGDGDIERSPLWVRRLGTSGTTEVLTVVYGRDDIYVAGTFDGTVAIGDTTLTAAGGTDAFIVHLAGDGTPTLLAVLEGPGKDVIDRLALEETRLVFSGWFEQTATIGDARITSAGGPDLVVGALDLR